MLIYLLSRYPHKAAIEPIVHFDFIVIGYHREAVEVLHPWIVDLDDKCIWASELYQTLEASLLYRNHILAFKELTIWNGKHRHRPARACAEVFERIFEDMNQSAPVALRHCFITESLAYVQGALSGEARVKNESLTYHLMPLGRRHGDIRNSSNSGRHSGRIESAGYPSTKQELFSCSDITKWNRSDPRCCSLDAYFNK